MSLRYLVFVCGTIYFGICSSATDNSTDALDQLESVAEEYFDHLVNQNPNYALSNGIYRNLNKTERMSPASMLKRKEKFEGFLQRLATVDVDSLPRESRVNYWVLEHALKTFVDLFKFRTYGYNVLERLDNYATLKQIQWGFAHLTHNVETRSDVLTFIERAKSLPGTVEDLQVFMEEAMRSKMTAHSTGVNSNFTELEGNETLVHKYFQTVLQLYNASQADKDDLNQQFDDVMENEVAPAGRKIAQFMKEEYMPRTRPEVGLWCLPDGLDLYQAFLQFHLSVNVTPDYVHQLGLREVKRIMGEIKKLFVKLGFKGTLKQFFSKLRSTPKFYCKNETDLLAYIEDLVYNKIEPKLPKLFKKKSFPELPLKVEEMPGYGPFGYYSKGKFHATFFVNIKEPERRPKYSFPALALHEGLPGHHMQLGVSHENLTKFRRVSYQSNFMTIPAFIPKNTAASEGWALYAEKLGYDLGLYGDPYHAFGQLEFELFRACRLVVDTGIHAKRWSTKRALDYMLQYSNLPRKQVAFEIDRYITIPGQACSYKIGELYILRLKKKAQQQLGSKFDIKEFHDRILSVGRVPLAVYDHVIDWYIRDIQSNLATRLSCGFIVYFILLLHVVTSFVSA